jgi:hypothetical protein
MEGTTTASRGSHGRQLQSLRRKNGGVGRRRQGHPAHLPLERVDRLLALVAVPLSASAAVSTAIGFRTPVKIGESRYEYGGDADYTWMAVGTRLLRMHWT